MTLTNNMINMMIMTDMSILQQITRAPDMPAAAWLAVPDSGAVKMIIPTLDFDHLAQLAETEPEQFERLRTQLVQQVIATAAPKNRRRLCGQQFQLDMERRRVANPVAACIRFSQLLAKNVYESFAPALIIATGSSPREDETVAPAAENSSATVIPFPSASDERRTGTK